MTNSTLRKHVFPIFSNLWSPTWNNLSQIAWMQSKNPKWSNKYNNRVTKMHWDAGWVNAGPTIKHCDWISIPNFSWEAGSLILPGSLILYSSHTQLMSCLLDRTSVHVWLFWILHHGDTVNWDAADDQPCPTPSSSEHSGTTYSKLHDIQINKTLHCSHR